MIKLTSYGFEYMTQKTARRIAKEDFQRELYETRQDIFEFEDSANQIKRIFQLQYDETKAVAKETKARIAELSGETKKSFQAQFSYFNTYANLTKKYMKKFHMNNESKFYSKYQFFK